MVLLEESIKGLRRRFAAHWGANGPAPANARERPCMDERACHPVQSPDGLGSVSLKSVSANWG